MGAGTTPWWGAHSAPVSAILGARFRNRVARPYTAPFASVAGR